MSSELEILSQEPRWRKWVPFMLIAGASMLAHIWCLNSVYFLDDVLQIRDNSETRSGRWWEVPLFLRWTYFSYWLQTLVWGTSSVGFHLVNWLLHTGVAVAIYVFGRDCLNRENAKGIALCGALLFVAHPLGSEIPNYARTQDLAWVTLFSILASWFAVRCLRGFCWPLLLAVLLCVVGATFSKGPGVTHALMMVVFALITCGKRSHWTDLKKRWKMVVSVLVIGTFFLWVSGMYGTFYGRVNKHWGMDDFPWHAVTLCRVFWKFVGLFFLPKGLCADHFIAATKSWEDEEAMPAVVGLVLWLLVATGMMFWSRTRFFGMCLWLFAGAIVLRFLFYINEYMPEYRIYPGLPWLCLGVMVALGALWNKLTKVSPAGLVGALVLVLCLVSAMRSFQWHDLDRLCAATLKEYPGHARALWMLQRRDRRLEKWDAIIQRHAELPGIMRSFDEEIKRTLPGKAMSVGHQIMALVACNGYYAEALAAKGQGRQALTIMVPMEAWLEKRVGNREKETAIWAVYDHSLGRVYERVGELEKALEALERTNGQDHRELDLIRVKKKLSEKRSAAKP